MEGNLAELDMFFEIELLEPKVNNICLATSYGILRSCDARINDTPLSFISLASRFLVSRLAIYEMGGRLFVIFFILNTKSTSDSDLVVNQSGSFCDRPGD